MTVPENKAFVEAFKKANNGMRPNFMAVGGYDGMHAHLQGAGEDQGRGRGEALVDAMKGLSWTSPRGPVSIDPADPRHHPEHLYPQGREGERRTLQRRVRHVENVKDPVKAAKKPSNRTPADLGRRAARPRVRRPAARTSSVRWSPSSSTASPTGCCCSSWPAGLSVTLGLMNFVNLAHGAFAMAGGYVTPS